MLLPPLDLVVWYLLHTSSYCHGLRNSIKSRRSLLFDGTAAAGTAVLGSGSSSLLYPAEKPVAAAAATEDDPTTMSKNGLAYRLAQRDPSLLKNKVFNLPPSAQIFPDWLRGTFDVTSNFRGYIFPSTKISRERLTRNTNIAGFQKCSIAAVADVGKDQVQYTWTVDPKTGLEDRASNFRAQIDAYLGYKAVQDVIYNAEKNPNRIGIDFVGYRTVNAERIELFCNARESESYFLLGPSLPSSGDDKQKRPIFVHAEYLRQVTFGTGSTPGVPRQVVTNYANFWTWQQQAANDDGGHRGRRLKGNLLTAAYLDPQDPMYFDEPSQPVAIYSHALEAKRIS